MVKDYMLNNVVSKKKKWDNVVAVRSVEVEKN
jgi:hypothetical protein